MNSLWSLKIINEPTAAGIAYACNDTENLKEIVLVFDLGGGTFDVAVLEISGMNTKVIAVGGDTHL